MDNVLQSDYSQDRKPGLPGQPCSVTNDYSADTRVVEGDPIPFGRACSQGETDNGVVLGGSVFVGVSVRDTCLPGPARSGGEDDPIDSYIEGDNAAIMTEDDIWVTVGAAVTPQTLVGYASATGIFGPHNGTYNKLVADAKFLTTSDANNLTKLRVSVRAGNQVISD